MFGRSIQISTKLLSFFALSIIYIGVALIYKLSQPSTGSKSYAYSPASAIAMAELIKFFMSCFFFYKAPLDSSWVSTSTLHDGTFRSRLTIRATYVKERLRADIVWPIFALATMYAINNQLTFILFRQVAPSHVNLAKSGSTFVTALLLYYLVGRKVVGYQWMGLFLQFLGQVLSQAPSTAAHSDSSMSFSVGLIVLLALNLSAFCGVLNDAVLKRPNVSMHLVNMGLYGLGFIYNLGLYQLTKAVPSWYGQDHAPTSFFAGYHFFAVMVIVVNSFMGLAISAVYKYADAIVKTLASAASVVILLFIEAIFFGAAVDHVSVIGCINVFVGTYFYFVGPKLRMVEEPSPAPGSADSEKMPLRTVDIGDDDKPHGEV